MLQIATGRFFTTPEVYEHSGLGVLYSNFTWHHEIETKGGVLIPADTSGGLPATWVFKYVNRMEKHERPGGIVRTGDSQLIQQFQLLSFVGLKAFFHVSRDAVTHACRERRTGQHDQFPPSKLVSRFVDPTLNGDLSDAVRLQQLVESALRLPRKRYEALINCARSVHDSLVVLSHNVHLAYSMLVFALESLGSHFDSFTPAWTDLAPEVRQGLDPLLEPLGDGSASAIRRALTETAHVKLTARFVTFVTSHLDDSFFRAEATSNARALRHSDLSAALKTAYATRSGFVHKLEPIRHQLATPAIAQGETFDWDRRPHLTYRGLFRIVHHVMLTFAQRGPHLDSEPHNWMAGLPGVVTLKAAPQYWIWNADHFTPSSARPVLSGFLEHLNEVMLSGGAIADMRDVCAACIRLLPNSKLTDRRAMLCIVILFNTLVAEPSRDPAWSSSIEKHLDDLESCCVERLLLDLVLGAAWPWPAPDCASCVSAFIESRHHKNSLELPRALHTALLLGVYNQMLGHAPSEAGQWARRAELDEAGQPTTQARIREALDSASPMSLAEFTGLNTPTGA